MKNVISMLIVVLCGLSALAANQKPDFAAIQAKAEAAAKETTPKTNRLTRAEIEQRPAVQKKTGGFIDVPATGLSVVVVDCREKAGGAPSQFVETFGRLSRTGVKLERRLLSDGDSVYKVAQSIQTSTKAVYILAVYENSNAPGLTIHPEARMALINAKQYQEGKDPLQREVRINKELWRALGFVSGLGYAPYRNDVFQPIFSVKELDALEYQVMQPMNFQKMYSTLATFGVKRARHIPYRLAVREGWASAPTNAYQKAIWEEVHSDKERGPTNPIKIEAGKKTVPVEKK